MKKWKIGLKKLRVKKKILLFDGGDPTATLNPDGDVVTAWDTFGSGSYHYDRLADADDSTGIQTVWEGDNDRVNIENMPAGYWDITSVQVFVRARSLNGGGAGEKIKILDRYLTSQRESAAITVDRTTFTQYSTSAYTTAPDGNPWTTAIVNALQIGVNAFTLGSGETLQVSKMWAEVIYEVMAPSIIYTAGTNTIRVNAFTEETPCTSSDVYDADVAGGWGVVTKQGNNQYRYDAILEIGDGVVPTYFADENQQILFSSTPQQFLNIQENGHFRLGKVVDATEKLSERGCHLKTEHNSATIYAEGELELYSSTLAAVGTRLRINFYGVTTGMDLKIWSCIFDKVRITINPDPNSVVDIYRLNIQKGTYGFTPVITTGTYNDILIHSITYAFNMSGGPSPIVKNIIARSNTYIMRASIYSGELYLINADVDSWAFFWSNSPNAKLWRQYEFDVYCQDKNGNDLNGVSVVAEYISPYGEAFSTTTDADGDIATQTVDHGWFDQANGDTEQLKTPLKVTYSKAGYQTVVKYYDLEEKTKDAVVLHKAVAVFISLGTPIVNLKKTDPENKNVLVL